MTSMTIAPQNTVILTLIFHLQLLLAFSPNRDLKYVCIRTSDAIDGSSCPKKFSRLKFASHASCRKTTCLCRLTALRLTAVVPQRNCVLKIAHNLVLLAFSTSLVRISSARQARKANGSRQSAPNSLEMPKSCPPHATGSHAVQRGAQGILFLLHSGHAVPIGPRVVRTKPETQHRLSQSLHTIWLSSKGQSHHQQIDHLRSHSDWCWRRHPTRHVAGEKRSCNGQGDLLDRFPTGQNALSCKRATTTTYPRCVDLRVFPQFGPHQNSWTPESSLWTMTWRVHNVTSWDIQVFKTFEGLLQTPHARGCSLPVD